MEETGAKKKKNFELTKENKKFITSAVLAFFAMFILTVLVIDSVFIIKIKEDATYVNFSDIVQDISDKKIYAFYTEDSPTHAFFKYIADVPVEVLEGNRSQYYLNELGLENWYETSFEEYDDLTELLVLNDTPIISNSMIPRVIKVYEEVGYLFASTLLIGMMIILTVVMSEGTFAGSSKFEVSTEESTRFSDVVGHDEVISDLQLYIEILKNAKKFESKGVTVPRGLLLVGPPETGKTLLAKSLAGEAKVPFIYLNSSNVIDRYVGVGARTIRSTFKKARSMSPCILFLDEIDAIGRVRGKTNGTSEDIQTINALLQEMDGFSTAKNVLVIAATNDSESLDSALLRAGRFDRKIIIQPPVTKAERLKLLQLYTKSLTLDDEVSLEELATQTSGFTGADIKVLCNEAAIISIQNDKPSVNQESFLEALDQLMLQGNHITDKDKKVNTEDRTLVAYHEAGHAVMCHLLAVPVARVSIKSMTSGVGGFVSKLDKDSQFTTKKDIENMIKIAYAGRASESIYLGDDSITNGASNDIHLATDLLMKYTQLFGFSDQGLIDYQAILNNRIDIEGNILTSIKELSKTLYNDCYSRLKDHYVTVEQVAQALISRDELSNSEFEAVVKNVPMEEKESG